MLKSFKNAKLETDFFFFTSKRIQTNHVKVKRLPTILWTFENKIFLCVIAYEDCNSLLLNLEGSDH